MMLQVSNSFPFMNEEASTLETIDSQEEYNIKTDSYIISQSLRNFSFFRVDLFSKFRSAYFQYKSDNLPPTADFLKIFQSTYNLFRIIEILNLMLPHL